MKKHLNRTCVAFVLGGLLLAPLHAFAANTEPSALAPKDSMIYVGIRNVDALMETLKRTAMWRMFEDSETKELAKSWGKIGTKLKEFAAKKLELENAKQLDIAPHGAVALFVTLVPAKEDGAEPDVQGAVVMEMGDDAKKTRRVVDAIIQKSLDNGAKKNASQMAGGEIISVQFERKSEVADDGQITEASPIADLADEILDLLGDDLPGGLSKELVEQFLNEVELPEQVVFAFRERVAVLASDEDTARQVLRILNSSKEDTFAGSPAMKSYVRRLGKDAELEYVINIPLLVDVFSKADAEAKSIMAALGLNSFGPLVLNTDFMPAVGVELRSSGFLEIGDKTRGLGKIFMMPNRKVRPPSTVSADSAGYASLNFDIAKTFEEVIAIVSRIDEADGEAMRKAMVVPQPDGTTLDIRKDLIAHLVGPVTGSFSIAKPYGASNVDFFMALGHKSREAWDKVFSMIPPGMLTSREMMGATIMDLSAAVPIGGLSLAVTDRTFLWIGTTNAVERYIRREGRDGGGLAETAEFQRLAGFLPKQASGVFFWDYARIFEAQLAASKAGYVHTEEPPIFGPIGGMLQWMIMEQFLWGDLELKRPEALRKYQERAMATIVTEDDGIRFNQVDVVVGQVD
ncbi:MAG: hypothetical protein GXP29_15670 [Planctomycetes bacterium]|nr:hypothetical protein [Planctomycetota bacterium]